MNATRKLLYALGPGCTHLDLQRHYGDTVPLEEYERLRRELWPGRTSNGKPKGKDRPGSGAFELLAAAADLAGRARCGRTAGQRGDGTGVGRGLTEEMTMTAESTYRASVTTRGEQRRWLKRTLAILGRDCPYSVVRNHCQEEGFAVPGQEEYDRVWEEIYGKEEKKVKLHSPASNGKNSGMGQAVLEAARSLSPGVFTLGQLVVCCWKQRPDLFTLEGTPHPSESKVRFQLYGTRGLLKRGHLVGVPGGFRVANGG